MKSAEMKTDGTAYYMNGANGWARGEGWGGARVAVLDTRGWTQGRTSYWNRENKTHVVATASGPFEVSTKVKLRGEHDKPSNRYGDTWGVLAVKLDADGNHVDKPFVAAPQHIRGTLAECAAKVAAYKQARQDSAERAAQARTDNKARAAALSERFEAVGFDTIARALNYTYGSTSVEVKFLDLERIAERLELLVGEEG